MSTDVDIDLADREQVIKLLKPIPAMQMDNGKPRKHNTGVYFHNAPINPYIINFYKTNRKYRFRKIRNIIFPAFFIQ